MSISQHCKQRDRIKEDLKWKREDLATLEEAFEATKDDRDCNFEEKAEIEYLKQEIIDLEAEWSQLTGEE